MSEHERRVNDRDIKAYEVNDTSLSNASIPGVRSNNHNVQEKYINKIFTSGLNTNNGSHLNSSMNNYQQINSI